MRLSHHPLKAHSFFAPQLFLRRCPFRSLTPSSLPTYLSSSRRNLSLIKVLLPLSANSSLHFPACRAQNDPNHFPLAIHSISEAAKSSIGGNDNAEIEEKEKDRASFWGAVSLIIGTAVGPGMLGLPSATIKAGPFPSTLAIILSWVYVISSIVLVAELSFAAMEEDRVKETSFTSLATRALGPSFGAFVAIVYACLSFSLLIACVSGIGSLVSQQFQTMNPIVAHALFPCFVGVVIGLFPFKVIDFTNRLLCVLMLFSISTLVAIGLSSGRSNLVLSFTFASWQPEVIMPAIPVTVLTLGFHVITPFICKLLRHSVYDARKAILFGGFVPLAMVLSWNAIVLALAGGGSSSFQDPIKLLLSVNASALPAVQGFAFAALATSLIGYAVSFPKQLLDTVTLIAQRLKRKEMELVISPSGDQILMGGDHIKSKVARGMGIRGEASSVGSPEIDPNFLIEDATSKTNRDGSKEDICSESFSGSVPFDVGWSSIFVTWIVLIVPIFIASFFQAAFAKALDFAGVYANCFLFGVLPPAMAWINRRRKRHSKDRVLIELLYMCRSAMSRSDLLPGGNLVLLLLFAIAVILGFWH
ncbi:hypothetical protein MA16_Dca004817 [Dendrobium catenatum]|uniref:Tyrosine-specific transport protein n=1 Tax=Dendrobium catenatum TaxID=906689 RepID=A0A2I0WG38_9ASPA|nr:hypothetical protein MA16_Dca004817 [Dendrobium catenatum]